MLIVVVVTVFQGGVLFGKAHVGATIIETAISCFENT